MAAQIVVDQAGRATIATDQPLPREQRLRFSLLNLTTGHYLTTTGWATSRKIIAELTDTEDTQIVLEPAVAALIAPGTALLLEEIRISLREKLVWPSAAKVLAPPAPVPRYNPLPSPEPATASPRTLPDDTISTQSSTATRTPIIPRRVPLWSGVLAGLLVGVAMSYGGFALTTNTAPSPPVASSPTPFIGQIEVTLRQRELQLKMAEGRYATLQAAHAKLNAQNEERGKLIETLQANSRPAAPAIGQTADAVLLQAARDATDEAKKENADLKKQTESQYETLLKWAAERTTTDIRIRELERQLASRDAAASASDTAIWLAAVVDETGNVQTVSNQTSRDLALSLAIKACGGAAKGCTPIGSYQNACFALSRPARQSVMEGNWWHAADGSKDEAERRSLYECGRGSGGSCTIRISVCSPANL